jgi:hypothetical protein
MIARLASEGSKVAVDACPPDVISTTYLEYPFRGPVSYFKLYIWVVYSFTSAKVT